MQLREQVINRKVVPPLAGPRIDEMRGVAALLVVVFHAIGADPIVSASLLGHLTLSLTFVRMPLFIAISGYLYGLQRSRRPLTLAGLARRARRILPPFLLLTVICSAISAAGGEGFHPVDGLLYGAWHMWYLQALLIITAIVTLIETFVHPDARYLPAWAAIAWFTVATGVFDSLRLFSTFKAMYLLPHFFAGAAFGALPYLLRNVHLRWAMGIAGLTALALNEASIASLGPIWERTSLVGAAMGVASFVLLATALPANTTLRRLGAYSLPIFLWHLPVSAVLSFMVLNRFGIEGHLAVASKVVAGMILPVTLSMLTTRMVPAGIVFVGARAATRSASLDTSAPHVSWRVRSSQAEVPVRG